MTLIVKCLTSFVPTQYWFKITVLPKMLPQNYGIGKSVGRQNTLVHWEWLSWNLNFGDKLFGSVADKYATLQIQPSISFGQQNKATCSSTRLAVNFGLYNCK